MNIDALELSEASIALGPSFDFQQSLHLRFRQFSLVLVSSIRVVWICMHSRLTVQCQTCAHIWSLAAVLLEERII